eukprot:1849043-Prymnesium_polylepis.1
MPRARVRCPQAHRAPTRATPRVRPDGVRPPQLGAGWVAGSNPMAALLGHPNARHLLFGLDL